MSRATPAETRTESAPAPRSTLRRIGRGLLWALLSIVVIVALIVAFVHTSWGKDMVRSRVEGALQKRVNGTVSLASVDYGFMFSDIELNGLVIATPAKDAMPPIQLERLYVDLDRGALLRGEPVLEEVVVHGGRVHIIKNADGSSNLTGLFIPSERSGRRITVERLQLSDLAVRIERPDGSSSDVQQISARGRLEIDSIESNYLAELSEVGAGAVLIRPDGTRISVPKATTAVRLEKKGDDLVASIEPIITQATLSRPGHDDKPVAIHVGKTTVSRTPSSVVASLEKTRLGPATIGSLTVNASLESGRLVGDQRLVVADTQVSHEELAELMDRRLLASDVKIDAKVSGPAERLVVDGNVGTGGGSFALDGIIEALSSEALAYEINLVGDDLNTDAIVAEPLRKGRPKLESKLHLTAKGRGIPRRPGSTSAITFSARESVVTLGEKVARLDDIDLVANLNGKAVSLERLKIDALGLDVRAAGELSRSREIDVELNITGDARGAVKKLRALGVKVRRLPISLPRDLRISARARGSLDGDLAIAIEPTSLAIAGGRVKISGTAELSKNGESRELSKANIDVVATRLGLKRLAAIAGRKISVGGSLSGTASIHQRGRARTISYDVVTSLDKPSVIVAAKGSLGASRARVEASVTSKASGAVLARLNTSVPLTQRRGSRAVATTKSFALAVDIPRVSLGVIGDIAGPKVRDRIAERASGGFVAATVKLGGTPAAPKGTISVQGTVDVEKLDGRNAEFALAARVSTRADGRVAAALDGSQVSLEGFSEVLATIGGAVSVAGLFRDGKLDRKAVRESARLEGVAIEVPRRPLAELATLRPRLSNYGGTVGLKLRASGSPRAPTFDLNGGWLDFQTISGVNGAVALSAQGNPESLVATVAIGSDKPLKIGAEIERTGSINRIKLTTSATGTSVASLLPSFLKAGDLKVEYGMLSCDLGVDVTAESGAEGFSVTALDARGRFAVASALVGVPNAKRRYKDIEVALIGDGQTLRLERLSAVESDNEIKRRTISLSGAASLNIKDGKTGLGPVKASLKASDWLVFGGSFGPADAPKATLTADVDVSADLSGTRPVIDITANLLKLIQTDRSDRDHAPEVFTTTGDIVFRDETDIAVGKLGVVREAPMVTTKRARRPMLVRLRLPKPASVVRAPLTMAVSGDLIVDITEDAIAPVGELVVHRGVVGLFGHPHPLESGKIVFSDAHPRGQLSLVFARELPPAVLRRLSKESGGSSVKITIAGSVADQKISLSGAGNSGMLDVMSAHNAGRSYYLTEPDLPATATAQAPHSLQPLVLTYLATNLPHMLILDRFSAWSAPLPDADAYGRVENFVGERTSADGKRRARIVARQRSLGRSGTEIQLDRVLVNTARAAVGVGIRAGSRLGGGLAMFFEWTSAR